MALEAGKTRANATFYLMATPNPFRDLLRFERQVRPCAWSYLEPTAT